MDTFEEDDWFSLANTYLNYHNQIIILKGGHLYEN